MIDESYLIRKKPRDVVLSIAQEDNIPVDIADDFVKVAGLESGRSHYDKHGRVKQSPVDPKDGQRAVGFSQIKPATAKSVGVADPYDETENIKAGLRYFAKGGDDPVRRRIAYFSGTNSKSVKHYDRTGKIPPGGDFTGTSFQKYVAGTGGFDQQQDPYLVPKGEKPTQPAQPVASTDDPYLIAKPTSPIDSAMSTVVQSVAQKGADSKRRKDIQAKVEQARAVASGGRFGAPQDKRYSRPLRPKRGLSEMATGGAGVVAPPGVGELRRLDDPETQQIARIQRQVTAEQTPVEREMRRAPGTQNARLLEEKLTENEEVLRRLEQEKDTAKREAAATAEAKRLMAQFTPEDKAEIADFVEHLKGKGSTYTGVRTGARAVGASGLYKLAGLTDIANAVQKPLTGQDSWVPDFLKRKALAGELSIEEIPVEQRGQVAEFITQLGLGLAEIVATPGGPVSKFAGLAGTESLGRGQSAKEIAKETAKGATIGGVFKAAPMLNKPARTAGGRAANLAREGAAIGAGTYAVERGFGTPEDEAALSAATNVALHGALGAKRLRGGKRARQTEAQPDVAERPVDMEMGSVARPTTETPAPMREGSRIELPAETAAPAVKVAEVDPYLVPKAVETAERRRIQREFDKIKESASKPVEIPVIPAEVRKAEGAQPAQAKTTPIPPETVRVEPETIETPYYHGTGREFDTFSQDAPKTTLGGLNRYGFSFSPAEKVGRRYAKDFYGDDGILKTANLSVKKPLKLTAGEFERLQDFVAKIDRGEKLSEVQEVFLEGYLEPAGWKAESGVHPIEWVKSKGYDAIEKAAGRGGGEPEVLVFDPSQIKVIKSERLSPPKPETTSVEPVKAVINEDAIRQRLPSLLSDLRGALQRRDRGAMRRQDSLYDELKGKVKDLAKAGKLSAKDREELTRETNGVRVFDEAYLDSIAPKPTTSVEQAQNLGKTGAVAEPRSDGLYNKIQLANGIASIGDVVEIGTTKIRISEIHTQGMKIHGEVIESPNPKVIGLRVPADFERALLVTPSQAVKPTSVEQGVAPKVSEQPIKEVINETTAPVSSESPGAKVNSVRQQAEGKAEAAPDKPITTSAAPSIARVPVSELSVDPERFQYKIQRNKKGGTGSLTGVKQWNPNLEGVVSVWRDPADGKTYIVNGHNRFEKAQELGVRDITVRHIEAPDAKSARAIGAEVNIAEGQGTAIDAAKFLKDSGTSVEDLQARGMPMERSTVKEGVALSKLDDFILNAVIRGELPQEHGVAIGNKIASPDLQAQAYKAISKAAEKGKTLTKGVVDEMLDAIGAAPRQTETEQSLFGDFQTERSLFNERAQVAAAIKRQLAGDKTLFGTAARRSGRLAEGGTKVDVDQAKALQESAAEALGVFDTLKNRTGGISDILDAGAKQVAAGKRPDAVAKESYERIKQAVNETIRGRERPDVPRGVEASERAEGEGSQRSMAENEGTLFAESEPSFVKSARERDAKRAADKAEGIEYRRAGADPYELIDNITIRGWDLYSQKIKPTFEEWSRKLREEFGPESESHLRKVWVQLGGTEPSSTAAKREKVTADRAARGEEPIPRPARKSDEVLLEDAKQANTKDPNEPLRLIDQVLNGKKGALSDKETVQVDLHVQELKNKYDAVNKKLSEATDPAAIKELSEQSDAMEREMRSAEEAFAASGTEKGRALRAQRVEIDQDFSLLTMISKGIKARDRELTRDERAEIKRQHDEIVELQAKLAESNERAERAEAERAVGKIKSDVAKENRRAGRRVKRENLDQEAAELKSLIAQAWKRQSSGGGEIHSAMGLAKLDPEGEVTKLVVQLAKNRLEAKIGLKAEALVDEVHGLLKDVVDLNRREVAEMISGYGKTYELSQEAVDVRLRELKSIIAANLGKADIIEKGIRPLRRGLQRDKPTQEVRQAMRDLRDTLREHGMKVERSVGSPEEQQKSALDAAKTRTKNRIEDLSKWIKDGKRTVANKTEIIPDAELKTLQAERDRLQKVFDAIVDPAADLKKIENSLRTVNKSIVDLEAKIRAGTITAKPREKGLTSPELEAARAEQKALRGIIVDLRRAAKARPTDAEAEAKRLLSTNKAFTTRMEKQIADLERRMKQGDFSKPQKREPVPFSRENLALQKQLEQVKREYAKANYKATRSRFGQITDELARAANVPKTMKSMGDISAVFRQGGFYSITHPIEGFAKPTAAMLRSFTETGFRNVEQAILNHPKYEQAKRDGVEFTGVEKGDPNLSHIEESFFGGETIDVLARGRLNPLKGVQAVKDFSQRTFVSFLDSQRMNMYDVMTDGLKSQGLTPRSDPASYKAIANLINIGTGRGNLGKTGNQAAPLLNIAMFSPRLVASRVQLLNKMLNPVAIARMPKGARAQNIKDNVKFLAATSVFMGLATAAGGTVNRDPDDADFLKIRFGKTTYDTLTGLQQPLRYIINMARAVTMGETYPGQGKAELTKRFARSKASPAISPIINWVAEEDFMGRKFSWKREAGEIALPLPAKDFWEAMEKEGLVKGFLKATPALTGIGVQTYKQPPEKPGTAAEKLARKFLRDRGSSPARDEDQIERDEKRAELRARARKGENVKAELDELELTRRQKKATLGAKGKTRLQEDFNRLDLEEAVIVYETMNADERTANRKILVRKRQDLLSDLPKDKQEKIRARLRALGLLPPVTRDNVQRYFPRQSAVSP